MTDKEIELLDNERQPCECWTRVMGYFRPIGEFNHGKKAEFRERKNFSEDKIKHNASPYKLLYYKKIQNYLHRHNILNDFKSISFCHLPPDKNHHLVLVGKDAEDNISAVGNSDEECLEKLYSLLKKKYRHIFKPRQIDIEEAIKHSKGKKQ